MENKNEKVMVNEAEKKDAVVQQKVEIGEKTTTTTYGRRRVEYYLIWDDISIRLMAKSDWDRGMFEMIMRDRAKDSFKLYQKHESWDTAEGEHREGDLLWVTNGKYSCRCDVAEGDKSLLRVFKDNIPMEK